MTATVGDNVATNERKLELWFRRQTRGVTYTLQAPSVDVKRAWLAEISCLLWRQAIQNRERRRSEMALHCTRRHDVTLSRDNHIHDRFLGISIASTAGTVTRTELDNVKVDSEN